jgi:cyclic pyranopterin phosphate synthase
MKRLESQLTHLNAAGDARMVDVSQKEDSNRRAVATSSVVMNGQTLQAIVEGDVPKGDVLAVARIAGIQAAKQCANLIPLCHPLALSSVEIAIRPEADLPGLVIEATCKTCGKTGVEMEALTAASVAALAVYDMCKAIDPMMIIQRTRLESKEGGKSGEWGRGEAC